MRRGFVSGLIGLSILLAGALPAQSAEPLECVTSAVDRKLSDEIFKAYRAEKNLGDALMAKVGDKMAACAAANDWSVEALESAIRSLFGQILVRGLLGELKAYKIDIPAMQVSIDKYLGSLAPDALRQFADGNLATEHGEGIVKQLVGDEVLPLSRFDARLGRLIGEYAAGRANETVFAAEFARQ